MMIRTSSTRPDSAVTFTDLFCGGGGSSTGLVLAGFEGRFAANHSQVSIDTHQANHPQIVHRCADINNMDMRRLPPTQVLWASPICTEISPAGGRRRNRTYGQGDLFDHDGPAEPEAYERTRATAYDVIRATEVQRYDAVMCENVVEWVTDWELFSWWRSGMHKLGYSSQILSFNSAHLYSDDYDPAPQWRDRIYVVFVRDGIRKPDLRLRPSAWCLECGREVRAFQSWRNGAKAGKYRQQYDYRCPNQACHHALVEPYVRPAASAINWNDIGTLISERPRTPTKPDGLKASTIARIRQGLIQFGHSTHVVNINHDGLRAYRPEDRPFSTRSTKIGDGIVIPPMLVPCGGTWNTDPTSVEVPMRARTTRDMEGLTTPPAFVAMLRNHGNATSVADPFQTFATARHHGLVVHDNDTVDVQDCHFRMITWRESFNAQGFPIDYIVHGTSAERTAQAGNAVSVNAARFIGERLLQVL